MTQHVYGSWPCTTMLGFDTVIHRGGGTNPLKIRPIGGSDKRSGCRKTLGKPWENGGLMGSNGGYPTW